MRSSGLRFPALSIRTHLAALALVVGVPLGLMELHAARSLYRMTVANGALSAQGVAESAGAAAVEFLAVAQGVMTGAAEELGPRLMDPASCERFVRALNGSIPFFINIVVADGDGQVVCSAVPTGVSPAVRGRAWFDRVLEGSDFAVADPAIGSITRRWVLGLGAPIRGEDGSLRGVLGGSVPLESFQEILAGTRLGADEVVTIVDAHGVVLARSADPELWVGKPLPTALAREERVEPGGTTILWGDDFEGTSRAWAKLELASVGWHVYGGIPAERVLGPARKAALQRALWTGLVALAAALLAALLHALISGSLRRLLLSTRAAADGAPVDVPVQAPTEVRALAHQLKASLDARSRAEAAERLAKERYRSIFDNAVFGVYASTLDGHFLEINAAMAAMLGYDAEELKRLGPSVLYRDPAERERYLETYRESRVIHGQEVEWIRKDGSLITVRLTGKLVERGVGQEAFEVMAEDITAEKRLQEELRHTQKMDALGRLAGGVAHDFNNLLTVIGGNSHVLLGDLPDDDPRRTELEEIAESVSRAEALTRQLLAFSRKERPRSRVVDVNDLLLGMERMLGRLMREDIRIRTDLDPRARPVLADPGQLEQVIINLAVNARDALPNGGRVLLSTRWSVVPPAQHRGPSGEGGWTCMVVTDNGVGMDAGVRERIFEPFFTTKGKGSGTGLGLATVYAIVEAAGGHIVVDSAPGRGARFEVWLPAAECAASDPRCGEQESLPAALGRGGTVLVVEDEAPVRRIVERVLTSAGFDVLLAADGREAIRLADEHPGPLALVITDVIMPSVKGGQVADVLARSRPETPVLFMSGYPDSPAVEARAAASPDTFLPKPFTPSQLRARVQRILEDASQPEPSWGRVAEA